MPSTLSQTSSFYSQADVHKYKLDDASIAVRTYGNGPALILIHGYPVHGYTWNKILPGLASCYTCHVIDLPGFGDSEWSSTTDFTFTAQARRINLLVKALELSDYSIIAHDTGATIARLAVVQQPQKVRKLVVINTEIPNHRPPWIPFYQLCAKLPLSAFTFKTLMKSKMFVRSSMGFKEFYADKLRFRRENPVSPYLEPLISSHRKMQGMLNYLLGIEWSVVDDFATLHAEIQSDTLLLWGECDRTFPVELAEEMQKQFSCNTEFARIKNASLMPHEEQPERVLKHILEFLAKVKR
jgi:pimeloyl-ACP methyl ester carboxylesterase